MNCYILNHCSYSTLRSLFLKLSHFCSFIVNGLQPSQTWLFRSKRSRVNRLQSSKRWLLFVLGWILRVKFLQIGGCVNIVSGGGRFQRKPFRGFFVKLNIKLVQWSGMVLWFRTLWIRQSELFNLRHFLTGSFLDPENISHFRRGWLRALYILTEREYRAEWDLKRRAR